jgi:hypothetical protein
MEAAALYAFAQARHRDVVCVAHLTNTMAQSKGDFEKGADSGSVDSLKLIEFLVHILRRGAQRLIIEAEAKEPFLKRRPIEDPPEA